jgi:putative ABC transport system permease protein
LPATRCADGKRLDLIRQLLAESFLLSLIALIASILLAKWIISALPSLLPADWTLGARLDGRVITFTAAVSLLTVFLFGLAPALHASRPSLLPLLKSDLAPRSLGRKHRGLNAVVIAQMSVGLVLVSIAMLLTRSVLKLYWGDLGFERKGVLLAYLRMPDNQQEGRLFCRQLIERIRGLPGVRQVSMARIAPFSPSGSGASQKVFLPQDQAATEQAGWAVKCNTIDPNYFRLLGIPIVRGRSFTDADNESSPRVVVINESMARRFWPNEDPVGQQIRLSGPSNQSVHIVGVVRDGKYVGIRREPEPYLFLPFAQVYSWETVLLVETGIEMATLARSVRKELRGLGVTLSRSSMSTLREHIRAQVSDQEILAKALAFFGLLGLGLASVGLYGILAYAISRRTQEIGIRMALGAQRGDLLKSILREGLGLALIGSIVGLSVAVAVARVLRSFLYRVNPLDPLSLAISSLLLLGVALLATYFPARRAAKVNPMVALRYE